MSTTRPRPAARSPHSRRPLSCSSRGRTPSIFPPPPKRSAGSCETTPRASRSPASYARPSRRPPSSHHAWDGGRTGRMAHDSTKAELQHLVLLRPRPSNLLTGGREEAAWLSQVVSVATDPTSRPPVRTVAARAESSRNLANRRIRLHEYTRLLTAGDARSWLIGCCADPSVSQVSSP